MAPRMDMPIIGPKSRKGIWGIINLKSLLQNPAAHTAHTADKMHATAAMRKNQDVFAFSLFIAVVFA